MKIEHLGLQVDDPAAIASWYAAQFGFTVKRSADSPVPVRFIADCSGAVLLEVYHNPQIPVPDYKNMDHRAFHLAFVCDDVESTRDRLVSAGATVIIDLEQNDLGDKLAMLRDPWGMAIQLAYRPQPMV